METALLLAFFSPHPLAAQSLDVLESAERAEAARIAMIERVSPAVVCVYDTEQHGGGSGVLIDEGGYGLTNFHVVADMLETGHGLAGLPDGRLYDLQVLGIDPGGDVAMFKVNGGGRFPRVRLGDSARVRVGDEVWAMGNPYVLSEDYTPTVSRGIVSGVNRYQQGAGAGDTLLYSDCLQIDAAINPGNSGGPLFNVRGEVIGLNGRISVSDRGRFNVGLGYAITTRQIAAFLPALRAGLLAEHGTLEAVVRDRRAGGVVFSQVREDGPAWNLGIRPGDGLLRFEGRGMPSANAFASVLGTLPANWPVAVTFQGTDNEIHHAIGRTAPVYLKNSEKFVPDESVNLEATQRVVAGFQRSLGIGEVAAHAGVGPWSERWSVPGAGAESPRDCGFAVRGGEFRWDNPAARGAFEDFPPLYAAYERLHDTLLTARAAGELADFRHVGADRLLRLAEDGAIREDVILEVLRCPLGADRFVEYQFNAANHQLRRIIARDDATGERGAIVFEAGWPTSGDLQVQLPDKTYRLVRRNVRLPKGITAPPNETTSPFGGAKEAAPPNASNSHNSIRAPGASPGTKTHNPRAIRTPVQRKESNAFASAIEAVTARTVKLIGARVGRSQGFGSGILVSTDGLVLTVASALLDGRHARAILADGTELPVETVRTDRDLQLALLRLAPKVQASVAGASPTYPCFDLTSPVKARAGQWVLAAGNPFKVASGAEPVSVSLGALGGRTPLDATRRAVDFPYRGPVWVIDAITSTPGYAGGPLCDRRGKLLGMIGEVVEARSTFTLINYAIPREVLAAFVKQARSGASTAKVAARVRKPVYHGIRFFELGYQSNPVYVDRVKRGSPAARAGLRKDDLIIGANGKAIPKLEALQRVIDECQPGDTLELTILRNDKVRRITIMLEEVP